MNMVSLVLVLLVSKLIEYSSDDGEIESSLGGVQRLFGLPNNAHIVRLNFSLCDVLQ